MTAAKIIKAFLDKNPSHIYINFCLELLSEVDHPSVDMALGSLLGLSNKIIHWIICISSFDPIGLKFFRSHFLVISFERVICIHC